MLSAPPVLVEPKNMIAGVSSPIAQDHFDWATQTPEPSPVCHSRVPLQQVTDHFSTFQNACNPCFEQMLTRIASHADVLEVTDASVRHQLIQTLCQPFFDHVVDALYGEMTSMALASSSKVVVQNMRNNTVEDDKPRLGQGRRLMLWEEDSTDVDNESAFVSLLSSGGEDGGVECSEEVEEESQSSLGRARILSFEDDFESLQDAEKRQMVCRHWKSKGWCRYASECKFSHPEHKQGVCAKGSTEHVSSSSRSSRRRASKNKIEAIQTETLGGSVVFAAFDSSSYSTIPYETCLPFASTGVWAFELQSHY